MTEFTSTIEASRYVDLILMGDEWRITSWSKPELKFEVVGKVDRDELEQACASSGISVLMFRVLWSMVASMTKDGVEND